MDPQLAMVLFVTFSRRAPGLLRDFCDEPDQILATRMIDALRWVLGFRPAEARPDPGAETGVQTGADQPGSAGPAKAARSA
jgi:hypothetical protein